MTYCVGISLKSGLVFASDSRTNAGSDQVSQYGKPILDRIISPDSSLEDAARCALVSMDSTMQSNVTVGPPVEMLIYEKDSLSLNRYMRLDENHPYWSGLRSSWGNNIRSAFNDLPRFNWESAGPPPVD